jgi:hypothetical protein
MYAGMNLESSAALGLPILIGVLLVFCGRRLFWVFVGGIGFLAGLHFAPMIAPDQPQWMILLIGLALGLVGAVLAILLQRVAVAVTGWFAGGLLAIRIASALGWQDQTTVWVAFIIGAIVAALVFSLLFDWALIAFTTFSGALLICDAFTLTAPVEMLLFAILVVVGAFVQSRAFAPPPETPAAGHHV